MSTPNTDEQNAGDARVVETQSRLADAAARVTTPQHWHEFLTLAADNPQMSAANLLLLWNADPTSGSVDSAAGWRARGRALAADAHGITVLTTLPSNDSEPRPRWRTSTVYSHAHTTPVSDDTPAPNSTPSSPQRLLDQLTDRAHRDGWTITTNHSPAAESGTLVVTPDAGAGQHCRELAQQLARSQAGKHSSGEWIARAATDLITRRAGLRATTPLTPPPAAPAGVSHGDHVRELTTRLVRTARALDPPPQNVSPELAARVQTARSRATETRERAELGAGASTGPAGPARGTDHLAHANEAAARYFAEQLQRSSSARSYLIERVGADADQLPAGWRVGYAPPGWTALRDHLREQGFNDDTLLSAGLAQRTQRGGVVDRFHHRLVIGVHDQHDRLTGFTGRTLHHTEGTSPKYLNTPATELYDKSNDVLGLTEQRSALADGTRRPLLVEGPLDALALAVRDPADGAWAPISTSGTAASTSHLNHIHASSSGVLTLGLDGDDAGRTATERLARLTYASPDRATRVLELPDGHDPASYLAAGGNPSPDETTSGVDWLLGRVLEGHRQLEHPDWVPQQAATLEEAAELLAPLPVETAAPLAARLGAELEQLPLDTVTNRVVQAHVEARVAPQRAAARSTSAADTASAPRPTTTPSTRPQTTHAASTTPPRARPTTPT